MSGLYTVGYESADLQSFIACLVENCIETLVDVRDYPLSRKKGFSKRALAEVLADAGVSYEHWQHLGAPKFLRHNLRETDDWGRYAEGYAEVLEAQPSALARLATMAQSGNICLMCFERDYRVCHRSLISERLESLGLVSATAHLTPKIARLASVA